MKGISIMMVYKNQNGPLSSLRKVINNAKNKMFSSKSQAIIELELEKSAHNYHPLPVVLTKGLGCNVWDVDGKVDQSFYVYKYLHK